MQIMEFFGFTCSNSTTGLNFPFMPESVMKDYPVELAEHSALSAMSFSPYDYVPMNLSSVYQEFVNSYLPVLQTPIARTIGVGIVAAAVTYYTWKVGFSRNADTPLPTPVVNDALAIHQVKKVKAIDYSTPKDRSRPAPADKASGLPVNRLTTANNSTDNVSMPEAKNVGVELAMVSENFQRQLMDALSKLDDVRFRLKELESEKELLTAEIELRKKITQRLQAENSREREIRQQAELKMEMMEIENAQLRQLRKEVALKTGQMEKLEKFIKDKDDLQIKLFEDNVVLPRAVAESRAKEFGTLQTRVHQLQAEVDATKRLLESSTGYYPATSLSSAWPKEGSVSPSLPMVSEIPVPSKKNLLTETSVVLPESNYTDRRPNARRKPCDRLPNISRSQTKLAEKSPKITRSKTIPALNVPKRTPSEILLKTEGLCSINGSKLVTNVNIPSTTTLCNTEDLTYTFDAPSNKNVGVFAHIRALLNGFRDSGSETDFFNPLEPSAIQSDQIALIHPIDMTASLERNQDYPLSDEQSSVFMSASGGSGTSDTDHHGEPTKSTGKLLNKKALPVKRLSRHKRARRRDKVQKRRLESHFPAGKTATRDTKDTASDSSDWSHKSTLKNYPIASKMDSNSQLCNKCTEDSQEATVSTPDSSDENDADSGDSWIVIMPAVP